MNGKNRRAHKLAKMESRKARRRAEKAAQKAARNGHRFAAPRHYSNLVGIGDHP